MSKSTQEKVRVYALAKELKVENKQVLELCQELGFASITNQLHGLDQPQVDAVKKRIKEGPRQVAPSQPAPAKPVGSVIPPPSSANSRIRTLPTPKPKTPTATPSAPREPVSGFVETDIRLTEPTVIQVPPADPVEQLTPTDSATPVDVVESTSTLDTSDSTIIFESKKPGPPIEHVEPDAVPPAGPTPAIPTHAPAQLPNLASINRGMPNLNANRPPVLRGAGGRPANIPNQRHPASVPSATPPATSQTTAAVAPAATTQVPGTPSAPVHSTPGTPDDPSAGRVQPTPASTQPRPPQPTTGSGSSASPNLSARPPRAPMPGSPHAGGRPGGPPPNIPSSPSGPRPGQSTVQPSSPQAGSGVSSPASGGSSQQQRPGGNFPPPRVAPPAPGMTAPYRGTAPSAGPGGPQRTGPITDAVSPGSGAPRPPVPASANKGQVRLTPEQIAKLREAEKKKGGKIDIGQVQKVVTQEKPAGPEQQPPRPGQPAGGAAGTGSAVRSGAGRPAVIAEDDDKPKRSPGEVAGRDSRTKHRNRDRGGSGPTDKGAIIIGAGGQVDLIEQAAGSRKGPRAALLAKLKRRQGQQDVKKEGPVEIATPITVRSLSEAIGMKLGELSKQLLKETAQLYGANSPIAFDVAELIAIGKGITLVAKKSETAEDILLERFKKQAAEVEAEKLTPRPPIVTIMGHVDHGKTSLLDKIRQDYGLASDVVSTEAGGITQVIRAWRVEKEGKPTTFLDTPGHEAFTKMRARGAKVTDIAVIVVAATDGVMPQTEEAINHAKAAKVKIIVAINKVDMPNANLDKTRRQLYSLELLPDNMGGDVPFVETSAVTGQGIGELLDAISIVAELSDPPLMADPEHKPSGTCLEAYMEGDRGVMATLLVQQGTLRKGDVILCGATYGRVRAMYDDLGRLIEEAGPSTPVKVIGLNEVPDADDPFYFVDDVTEAREIAETRALRQVESGRTSFAPKNLEAWREASARNKISELKVVLKAEARGSVEAIKKELEKLTHEEVRCRVLHSGIGAINESDVTLALTSPTDTIIIGFNVTADDAALRLAEERGISLREYDIIYKLTDDVKSALEGKLKPIEEVVHLGRAVVRETFKISKVGTIAGCYVTSGVIERSARVRVIREGTVIYPPSEKTLGLDSLKRFKDDAKEVREGFECGMKIVGFDDVKVGDVIEAFRIEIRQRTL